jgi:hypothetical protein
MITLISLLNIVENKQNYNEEFEGYYLGHNSNTVIFGYLYPLYKLEFTRTESIFSYKDIKKISKKDFNPFRIPTINDIKLIRQNDIYKIVYKYLTCWVISKNEFFIYDFSHDQIIFSSRNHIYASNLLLICPIDILK